MKKEALDWIGLDARSQCCHTEMRFISNFDITPTKRAAHYKVTNNYLLCCQVSFSLLYYALYRFIHYTSYKRSFNAGWLFWTLSWRWRPCKMLSASFLSLEVFKLKYPH